MPNHVLELDCTIGNGDVEVDLVVTPTDVWVEFDIAFNAAAITAALALTTGTSVNVQSSSGGGGAIFSALEQSSGTLKWKIGTAALFTPSSAVTSMQFYHIKQHLQAGSPGTFQMWIDGTNIGTSTAETVGNFEYHDLAEDLVNAGSFIYYDNFKVGTTEGASDLGSDDFEGGSLAFWNSDTSDASIIVDPGITPAADNSVANGRVLIAFDDGPLEPTPTWTVIDQGDSPFPQNFVSGYDTHSGRQTLISQTETGTATVYVNDRSGLFDDRNGSSPFQGKLSGRQIMLQLYNPFDATWESQFRGLIDEYRYDIDGSAVGADGQPINATVQIECVDIFDYLNGYGLTPGLDGVTPPPGAEDSIYYPANGVGDTVSDRILEILTDANIDPSMSILGSGSVQVIATQYNADESALTAIRDAADAEFPYIGNIYVNRSGLVCFRGRYSRFAPDEVAAEPSSLWDFTRWKVGDGKAIQADPTRAQMRLFQFSRDRSEIINAALCYPQGTKPADIPGQVYANTTSITAYGKHEVSPLSDLITGKYVGFGTVTPDTGLAQCALYAELLVKNKKDPIFCPTALQVKAINAQDFRASATWDILTRSDIGHIVNIAVGYPGGTGLMGGATVDDYYIEGRALTVRPANAAYDYVEMDLEVTPYRWSADTHGVFPAFGT